MEQIMNTQISSSNHPSGSNAPKPKRVRASQYQMVLGGIRQIQDGKKNIDMALNQHGKGTVNVTVTTDWYNAIKSMGIHIPPLTGSITTFSGSMCDWAGITLQVSGSIVSGSNNVTGSK